MILLSVALIAAAVPASMILSNLFLFHCPAPASERLKISVVVPARDEEDNIGAACAAVLASQNVDLELIVVDDHSTDKTHSILAGIDDPRLSVAIPPPLPSDWSGKQHACSVGAELARHELILFVDADVRLAPDALARIGGFMQRETVGLGSGFPRELSSGFADGLLVPLIHWILLGFLPILGMRRSLRRDFGAGCGQMIAVRRDAYSAAGGHAAIKASLHDGLALPRQFRASGIMTGIFDASPFASCKMYDDTPGLIKGLLKNATEGMATPAALPIWTLLLGFGQVLSPALLIAEPGWWTGAALGLSIVPRLIIAVRFRAPIWSAVLHPIGVAGLLALQWVALIRHWRGRSVTWRGRGYAT